MSASKTRRQIAWLAARLMYERSESEYYRAKMKAAQRVCRGWVKPRDLPSNAEIRDEIQNIANIHEGDARLNRLRQMRLAAFRMMKLLSRYRPRLIGSVLTGHIREGSDIDLHLFSNNLEAIATELEQHGFTYEIERKQVRKDGELQTFRHIHVSGEFPFELTVYQESKVGFAFKSSITGKPIEKASLNQLEALLQDIYPEVNLEQESDTEASVERFQLYLSLLLPLENVKQSAVWHPEGDALYHSLQVFDLACDQYPYDEEFLLAALLHDVGKGIDPRDHVNSGLEALHGFIGERTRWMIANHMLAHKVADGSIGRRQHRRLQENESYQELMVLGQCDREGRSVGVETTPVEEALDYIRDLANL